MNTAQPTIEEATKTRGAEMYALVEKMYPICRSITGDGVRQTLALVAAEIPLTIHEVPTGKQTFDWTVPKEWNIRDAYIRNSKGEKVVDFKNSNLHVMGYSIPVHAHMSWEELKKHVHVDKNHPEWVPYRTAYFKEDWAFCMSLRQFESMKEDTYEVYIDSTLGAGFLTYGECYIKGSTDEEVLISTHVCHPSLANDNLSGIAVAVQLVKNLLQLKQRYSYRFIFIPATVGSITWLATNENNVGKIKHGLVATLLGDSYNFTYKRSRRGNAEIDRVAEYVLKKRNPDNAVLDWFPYGYDERQFCSPGFNLPVGRLTRVTYGEYPEYHTSADNLSFVRPENLEESLSVYLEIFAVLEQNRTYINLNPKCEPQLGRRGIYSLTGGHLDGKDFQLALLWVLSLADGTMDILEMVKRTSFDFETLAKAASILQQVELLKET